MSGLVTELVVSKSVRDTATVLDWVHGPKPGDPYGCPDPDRPYVNELTADPGKLNIAILTDSMTGDPLDRAVLDAVHATGAKLEGLGHNVTTPELPEMGDAVDLYETFMTRWAAGMAESAGVLGTIVGRDLTPDDVEPLTWALIERGRSESSAKYLAAISSHQWMSRMIAGFYETGIDLLVTPTLGKVPPELGFYDQYGADPMDAMDKARQVANFTGAFNATGQPAISLPLEVSEEGLPIGIQFIAPIWREDLLIRLAAQLEQAHPWAGRRAPAFTVS